MEDKGTKRLVAKSTAEYRGVQIMETETGVVVFMATRRYDCKDLAEATALIDTVLTMIAKMIEPATHYIAPARQ